MTRSMRVILVHNPTAGSEDHSAEELEAEIRAAGHELLASIDDVAQLGDSELVAVAGGDGTVGRVAVRLRGSQAALTVIPVGTANNVARTLGLGGDARALVRGWAGFETRRLDLGTATMNGATRRFVEVLGFGAFPAVMQAADGAWRQPEEAGATLDRDRAIARAVLRGAHAEDYRLIVDDEDLSGAYLGIEIMNIPYVGPHLELAPGADPSDGWLDVVLFAAEHRDAMKDHAAALRGGSDEPADLPVRRARRITIETSARGHLDGELLAEEGAVRVAIAVEPGAVRVLAPPRRGAG